MLLSKRRTATSARWVLGEGYLPKSVTLELLLELPRQKLVEVVQSLLAGDTEVQDAPLLPPIEPTQEVWASGVTYQRSRNARKAESATADVYDKVYEAERPELFFKALGWRVVGDGSPIRIRRDSRWNVPEPELVLVLNRHLELIGFCAGNDVSSRAIEGENPLYLPQAKVYNGSCALGPGIQLLEGAEPSDLAISLTIVRREEVVFEDTTSTSQMKRSFEELVQYLGCELSFPHGVFLMTGTGLVPPDDFSLEVGDVVTVTVGELRLENPVAL